MRARSCRDGAAPPLQPGPQRAVGDRQARLAGSGASTVGAGEVVQAGRQAAPDRDGRGDETGERVELPGGGLVAHDAEGTERTEPGRCVLALPGTSSQELTRALRSLARDRFITRAPDPDSTGYSLTPLGRSLLAVLLDVYAWSAEHWDEIAEHWDEIADARERTDPTETGSSVNDVLTCNS